MLRSIISVKYLALALLVLQNTFLVVFMHYSRTIRSGSLYASSTAVVSMEFVKFFSCMVVIAFEEKSILNMLHVLRIELTDMKELLLVSVSAILYTIQNNLLYYALSHLDAATFQVGYQVKILTTAVFSVTMLGKKLSLTQWNSLILLTIGVVFAQLSTRSSEDGKKNTLWGFIAVLSASCTSGFAGVYFEKVLKKGTGNQDTGKPPKSLWVRNIQLGISSIILGTIGIYGSGDLPSVMDNGFFHGYNMVVISVVLLQAIGGLVVAVVVNYADNILKGFAASFSIITSCILSYFVFDFHPNLMFLLGATLVNISMYLYSFEPKQKVKDEDTKDSENSTTFSTNAIPIVNNNAYNHQTHDVLKYDESKIAADMNWLTSSFLPTNDKFDPQLLRVENIGKINTANELIAVLKNSLEVKQEEYYNIALDAVVRLCQQEYDSVTTNDKQKIGQKASKGKIVLELGNAGVCHIVDQILGLQLGISSCCEFCLRAITSLIYYPTDLNSLSIGNDETGSTIISQNRKKLSNSGTIYRIIKALQTHFHDPVIVECGLKVIYYLSLEGYDIINKLIACGTCDILPQVLYTHAQSQNLMVWTCRNVCLFIMTEEQQKPDLLSTYEEHMEEDNYQVSIKPCQYRFADFGICESIVMKVIANIFNSIQPNDKEDETNNKDSPPKDQSMETFQKSIMWCLKAIGCLTRRSYTNKKRFSDLNISTVITKIYHSFGISDPYFSESICWAIASLSYPNEENQLSFGSTTGCEIIMDSLQFHQASVTVIQEILRALRNLCCECDFNLNKLMELGITDTVMKVINIYRDNGDVLQWIWYAVASLANHPGCLIQLGDQGIVKEVVRSIVRFSSQEDVVQWAAVAIATICQDFRDREVAMDASYKIIKSKINFWGLEHSCQPLTQALSIHYANADVAEELLNAIGSLMMPSLSTSKLLMQNSLQNLAAEKSDGAVDTIELNSIRFQLSNRIILCSAGACELILKTLNKHDRTQSVIERGLYSMIAILAPDLTIFDDIEAMIGNSTTDDADFKLIRLQHASTVNKAIELFYKANVHKIIPRILGRYITTSSVSTFSNVISSASVAGLSPNFQDGKEDANLKDSGSNPNYTQINNANLDYLMICEFGCKVLCGLAMPISSVSLHCPWVLQPVQHTLVQQTRSAYNPVKVDFSVSLESKRVLGVASISTLCNILNGYMNQANVTQWALLGIYRLSGYESNLKILRTAGICPIIGRALFAYYQYEEFQGIVTLCLLIISELCKDHMSREMFGSLVVSYTQPKPLLLIECIISLVANKFIESFVVLKQLCDVVSALCISPIQDALSAAVAGHIVISAHRLLEAYSQSKPESINDTGTKRLLSKSVSGSGTQDKEISSVKSSLSGWLTFQDDIPNESSNASETTHDSETAGTDRSSQDDNESDSEYGSNAVKKKSMFSAWPFTHKPSLTSSGSQVENRGGHVGEVNVLGRRLSTSSMKSLQTALAYTISTSSIVDPTTSADSLTTTTNLSTSYNFPVSSSFTLFSTSTLSIHDSVVIMDSNELGLSYGSAFSLKNVANSFVSTGLSDREEEVIIANSSQSVSKKSNATQLIESGVLPLLQIIVQTHQKNDEVLLSAINCINCLSHCCSSRALFCTEGLIQQLVEVFRTKTKLAETSEESSSSELSTSISNSNNIVQKKTDPDYLWTDNTRLLTILLAVTIGSVCIPDQKDRLIKSIKSNAGNKNISVSSGETLIGNGVAKNSTQDLLINLSICKLLCFGLESFGQDPFIVEAILRCIYIITNGSETIQIGMSEARCPTLVVVTLTQLFHFHNVIYFAALAVSALALNNRANTLELGQANICVTVTELLNRFIDSERICEACCHALYGLKGLNRLLGECGACRSVLQVFELHSANAQVAQWVCRAIGSLADSESNKLELDKHNVSKVVTLTLQKHVIGNESLLTVISNSVNFSNSRDMTSVGVVYWACTAIYYLAKGHASTNYQHKLLVAGAAEIVDKALVKYAEQETIAYACCRALVVLLINTDTYKNKLGNLGVCNCVVESLHLFPSSAMVAKWGCRAVAVLAESNESNISKFGAAGACETIPVVMQAHQNNDHVSGAGCDVIAFMTDNLVNGLAARFGHAGACEAIISVLKKHSKHGKVISKAGIALASIARIRGNAAWLGPAGACDALYTVLQIHLNDVDVCQHIIAAMGNLCIIENNQDRLGSIGVCTLIVRALATHVGDLDSVRAIALTIGKLCEHISIFSKDSSSSIKKAVQATEISSSTHMFPLSTSSASTVVSALTTILPHSASRDDEVRILSPDDSNSIVNDLEPANAVCDVAGIAIQDDGITAVHDSQKQYFDLRFREHVRNRNEFLFAGVCEAIANAITIHTTDAVAAQIICRTVAILSNGEYCSEERNLMGQLGVCKGVANALQFHEGIERVSRAGCLAIRALTLQHPVNQDLFRACGILPTVVSVMKTYRYGSNNSASTQNALSQSDSTTSNLQNSDGNSIQSNSITPSDSSSSSTSTSEIAAWAVLNLTVDNYQNKVMLGDNGACEVVLECIEISYRKINSVLVFIAALFHLIDGCEKNRRKIAFSGAADALIVVLNRYADDERVTEYVYSIMICLCWDKVGQSRLGTVGTSKSVINSLYRFERSEHIAMLCCALIGSLAKNSLANQSKLGQAGAIKAVFYIMTKYATQQHSIVNMPIRNKIRINQNSDDPIDDKEVSKHQINLISDSGMQGSNDELSQSGNSSLQSPKDDSVDLKTLTLSKLLANSNVIREGCKAIYFLSLNNEENRLRFQATSVLDILTSTILSMPVNKKTSSNENLVVMGKKNHSVKSMSSHDSPPSPTGTLNMLDTNLSTNEIAKATMDVLIGKTFE